MTDPTIPATCLTCRHWQSADGLTSGICRRNAPITIPVLAPTAAASSGSVLKTVWPSTGPQDFCGEHGLPFDAPSLAEGA